MFSTSLRHVTDGGLTWGDPTIVHQHATETDYAVDANVLDHILAMTRKQRSVLRGEDETAVLRETGGQMPFPWKDGLLLESTDGGRSFREVLNSYTNFYGHRGNICWSNTNVVIVAHNSGTYPGDGAPKAYFRISLDGSVTWMAGTRHGTSFMNRLKNPT